MTSKRSRVPESQNLDPSLYQFLDAIDKRQQRVAEIENVSGAATTVELAAAINAILEAHRTR